MSYVARCSTFRPVSRPVLQVGVSPAAAPVRPKHGLNVSNGYTVYCMRHGKKIKKLGRPADQRKALIRALVTEVLRHGQICTTRVKAKAAVKYVDHIITLAKRGDDHARIQAKAFVYDPHLVDNIFIGAPQRFKDRDGGYCRVIRPPTIALRRGDRAEMAILQLSDLDAYGV